MNSFFSSFDFNTVLIMIGGLLLLWQQYRQGASKVSAEVITTYREQVAQYKEQVSNFTLKMNQLTQEIGKLEGTITEKDKQIKNYEMIMQNRNPELTNVLTEIRDFMKTIHGVITESQKELNWQSEFMSKEKNKKRRIKKS